MCVCVPFLLQVSLNLFLPVFLQPKPPFARGMTRGENGNASRSPGGWGEPGVVAIIYSDAKVGWFDRWPAAATNRPPPGGCVCEEGADGGERARVVMCALSWSLEWVRHARVPHSTAPLSSAVINRRDAVVIDREGERQKNGSSALVRRACVRDMMRGVFRVLSNQ